MDTGEEYYFIRDNVNNTIYSSLTNTTIPIEQQANASEPSIQYNLQRAKANDKFIGTKTISTKTILVGVTAAAGATKIAAYILSYFGLIGAAVKLIVNILATAAVATAGILHAKYTKVRLDHYKYQRSTTKNGKVYRYWVDTYRNVRLIK